MITSSFFDERNEKMLKLISIFEVSHHNLKDYLMSFSNDFKEVSKAIYMACLLDEVGYQEWLKNRGIEHYYLMIDDENPSYIIGDCTVNTKLNFHLNSLNMGAIGYSVRPTERNKHYGTYMLKLLLLQCQNLGLKEVCISCWETNLASKKIIESNGGLLDKRFFDTKNYYYGLKYWVQLEETSKTLVNK